MAVRSLTLSWSIHVWTRVVWEGVVLCVGDVGQLRPGRHDRGI